MLFLLLLLIATPTVGFSEECVELDWKQSGLHKLPQSNASIHLPEGYFLLTGKDARKERELSGSCNDEDVEAIVWNDSFKHLVLFENIDSGYVSIDDWAELDSKALLNEISKNTEHANIARKEKGFEELHVVGWTQEPTLDKETNTVFWAIEGKENDGESFINSVALRLGRYGYERIVWITQKDLFESSGSHLDAMLQAYAFDEGYRYQDFEKGDRMAEYGIATLVAASVGGKILKATGLLVILKKFSGGIIALFMALIYKIKNFFKRKPLAA